jgi:outer membrane protein assembly factor BamA
MLFGRYSGFGLRFGGLVTGSGFALGPAYSRPELKKENIRLRLSAVGTLKQYYRLDVLVSVPRLFLHRLSLDFYGYRSDSPQTAYYGPGPDSHKTGRTNFRREDLAFDFRLGLRPHRRLFMGMTAGGAIINVGPGTSTVYASADRTYTPRQTPGIDEQTDYGHVGPFVQVDFRDKPADPHRGGNYVVRYVYFHDDELFRYSFRRLEATVEQYVPLLNEKRVFALRAQTDFSFTNETTLVPFYMQPTLGGSDDLRGYRQFRYYDNNRLVMNAEYRWEVIPALDMAVFADAGKVFHRPGEFSLTRLKAAGGFGARFKSRDAVVFRLDTGFSREGFQVWFKFGGPFRGLFHSLF